MTKADLPTDLSSYLTKPPTDLQRRFAEYITSPVVGYDPSAARSKQEAFEEGVRLGVALRMIFQASPENKEARTATANGRATAEVTPKKTAGAKKTVPAKASAAKPASTRPSARKRSAVGETPAPF